MHSNCTTQLAFIFGGLLRQNVTLEGLAALNGATWTDTETLFSAALGLHFGHVHAPFNCAREALRTDPRLVGPEPLLVACFMTPLLVARLTAPRLRAVSHPQDNRHKPAIIGLPMRKA
jgi:hypothetical protein